MKEDGQELGMAFDESSEHLFDEKTEISVLYGVTPAHYRLTDGYALVRREKHSNENTKY